MKFIPTGNRILVKAQVQSQDKKTESGIIIPIAPNKESTMGTVVAIGDGVTPGNEDKRVMEGDTVQFEMYSGKKTNVGGEEFLLVEYDKVEGIFRNN